MKYTGTLIFNHNFYYYYHYLFYLNKPLYSIPTPRFLKQIQSFWVKRVSKKMNTYEQRNLLKGSYFVLNDKIKLRLKRTSLLINQSISNKNNINFKQVYKILFLSKTFYFKNYVLLLNLVPNFRATLKISYHFILTHIRFLKQTSYTDITKMFYYTIRVTKSNLRFRNVWCSNLSLL